MMEKNNMLEKWIQWKPIEGLSSKYYISSVIDNVDKFKIILTSLDSEKNIIEILFKNGVDAYSKIEESFRVKLIYELDKNYGINFYKNWTFFKVINSEYISWLSEQSYEWSNTRQFIHFSLLSSNFVIDIIADYEPEVKIIKQN